MQTMDQEHKISIIVPAYNAEKTLDRCIASLLRQSYKNIEIILVDDGSEDQTRTICCTYQQRHVNLMKVIHTDHGGVTRARLLGLRKAMGELAAFVDADDWIEEDYLSSLQAEMGTAELVAGGIYRAQSYDQESGICEYNSLPLGRYRTEPEKIKLYEKMLYAKAPYQFGVLPYMCNKLFKKDRLSALMEKTDKRIYDGEDAAVVYPYLLSSNEVVISDNCKYHYILHKDSASFKTRKDAYLNASYLYQELYRCFLESKYQNLLLPQLDQYMRRLIWKMDPAQYLNINSFVFPYRDVEPGSRIILYGMGKMGNAFYQQIKQMGYCEIVAWADRNAGCFMEDCTLVDRILPEQIKAYSFDYIVIAVEHQTVRSKIAETLCAMGIDKKCIRALEQAGQLTDNKDGLGQKNKGRGNRQR